MKRLLLSIFLAFHLFGVIISPNMRSFLKESLAPVYRPYMRALNLDHSWGFFAPEPVYPPLHYDYSITLKDGQTIKGRFPDEENPFFFRDRHNRRMSLTTQIGATTERLRGTFVHHLCKKYPLAVEMKLWRLTGKRPSFEEVKHGVKRMTETVDYHIDVLGDFYCIEGGSDAISVQ